MERPTIIERDGKKYLRLICPSCGNELLFRIEKEERRVHFACAACGKVLETCVPAAKDVK